jgi:GTPase SAR1 family protein
VNQFSHNLIDKLATLKVILLGNSNVGKTSIINKYIKDVFYEKPSATVGVDFANKILTKDDLKEVSRTTSTFSDLKGSEHKDS